MSKYRIRMNGKTYEMEVELVDEHAEIQYKKGFSIPSTPYSNTQSADSVVRVIGPEAKSHTENTDNKVKSPMPGTILSVLAKAGDPVEADSPVMILEAMKMENEICAPFTGVLKEVFVKEGQTVPAAFELFEMEGK